MRASIQPAAFFLLLLFALSCGGDDLANSNGNEQCALCPELHMAVDYCPAFQSCVEVDSYDETLICAPQTEENVGNSDAGIDEECKDDVGTAECPAGSIEVTDCPDGYLCTWIPSCDESLLCLELQDACALEPLCPDDDRGVEDYECRPEDETCYKNYHCSGPISCLRCELLPEECPEDSVPIDPEECDDETRPCERVETCDETLYCAPPECEAATCPGESVPLEECPEDGAHCLTIPSCNSEIYCGAPPHEPNCRALPTCPDDLQEVSLHECQASLDQCTVKAACGKLAACLPDPQ